MRDYLSITMEMISPNNDANNFRVRVDCDPWLTIPVLTLTAFPADVRPGNVYARMEPHSARKLGEVLIHLADLMEGWKE